MARKFIFLAVFALVLTKEGVACDACGCSALGSGVGLLATFHQSTIGLQYNRAPFISSPSHGHSNSDYFHTVELVARIQLARRLKIQFSQPYRINTREHSWVKQTLQGLGDSRFNINYVLVDRNKANGAFSVYADAGLGIKAPSARFDKQLIDQNLPENFNLGTGSWAGIAQTNVGLNFQNSGLALTGTFQHNWHAEGGYQFGDQWSYSCYGFHQFYPVQNWMMLTPFGGLAGEWIAQDRQANSKYAPSTGGKGLFATIGVNIQVRKWLLGGSYSRPLKQAYSGNEILAKPKFSIQFSKIIK